MQGKSVTCYNLTVRQQKIQMNWKALSGIALLVLIGCVSALVLREAFFGNGPVTITLQVAAALLMLWARFTFGIRSFHGTANPTAGGLVTNGPFKYFRHPIYAAILYCLCGTVAAHFSIVNVALALLAAGMLFTRMLAEEALLARVYPNYVEYSQKTKRVIPFVL
jgi:protein-S-isoprenylcysteine O-methyltransferase Ste14